MSELRADLKVIADWVEPGTRVLDIGCGDGELLAWLAKHKNVDSRGIEISQNGVSQCVTNGLSVIQGDADADLKYYPEKAFDYAILSQTLQTMNDPRQVLIELVRIAKHAIVSVPNFGYWLNRLYLMVHGRMPVTKTLSYEWYDTPNIHFCTISDFIILCESLGLKVEQRIFVNNEGKVSPFRARSWMANMFGQQGVFMLRRE